MCDDHHKTLSDDELPVRTDSISSMTSSKSRTGSQSITLVVVCDNDIEEYIEVHIKRTAATLKYCCVCCTANRYILQYIIITHNIYSN